MALVANHTRGAHMRPLPSPLRAPLLLRKVVCNVQVALSWPCICFVLTFGEHVHRNMKHQCSMRRLTITSANNKNLYVAYSSCVMYISSCSIRSWNWNRKLKQDHFLIEHWIQRTHRCPAVRCWPWVYYIGHGQPLQPGGIALTWRDLDLSGPVS